MCVCAQTPLNCSNEGIQFLAECFIFEVVVAELQPFLQTLDHPTVREHSDIFTSPIDVMLDSAVGTFEWASNVILSQKVVLLIG